jgi:hypothetical protein
LRQTGSPSPGHWRLTPALLPPATSNPPLAPLTRSASRKRDSGSHFPTFPPFTRYCGSPAPACFFHSSKVSMSICQAWVAFLTTSRILVEPAHAEESSKGSSQIVARPNGAALADEIRRALPDPP